MRNVLGSEFFERATVTVAKELLGKFLVRKRGNKTVACMITETEAYDGFKDKASHVYPVRSKAFNGAHWRKTKRNEIMFGQAGYWYVYFTYGMHYMLNVVTGRKGYPAAVLIRGVVCLPARGLTASDAQAGAQAGGDKSAPPAGGRWIDGPAKLTKFLRIDKTLNALPASGKSGLWIEDRGLNTHSAPPKEFKIEKTPRIGVHYAGVWAKKPYRFVLKQSGARNEVSRA